MDRIVSIDIAGIEVREKVKGFIEKYGMGYENIDLKHHCNIFIKEMKKGLEGDKSSLKMIPTYISMSRDIPTEEPVIVIDAGGTNFRTAVVYFDRNKIPVIEDFRLYPMPGTQGEVDQDEFFETIAGYIKPLVHRSSKIGFCFSYATEMFPNKDGRHIKFSKEVQVKGLEGKFIGAGLLNTLKKMGISRQYGMVLLNDTVATLLGGKASCPQRLFDGYIVFILGTGTNTCYEEKVGNIKKLHCNMAAEDSMLINIESGGYNWTERGVIDSEFDRTTVNPGEYVFEKMISGGYQGGLMQTLIKKAAEEGLFSCTFRENFGNVKTLISKDIDDFLHFPYAHDNVLAGCCDTAGTLEGERDRMVLYFLADALIERAARLVAVNLASVILKTGRGKNPCAPVCIAAEGTTFYKSKLFRGKLDYYVKTFMNDREGIYCEFVKTDNATLVGTAIAGLAG